MQHQKGDGIFTKLRKKGEQRSWERAKSDQWKGKTRSNSMDLLGEKVDIITSLEEANLKTNISPFFKFKFDAFGKLVWRWDPHSQAFRKEKKRNLFSNQGSSRSVVAGVLTFLKVIC